MKIVPVRLPPLWLTHRITVMRKFVDVVHQATQLPCLRNEGDILLQRNRDYSEKGDGGNTLTELPRDLDRQYLEIRFRIVDEQAQNY